MSRCSVNIMLAFLILASIACSLSPLPISSSSGSDQITSNLSASDGGELVLPDGAVLRIPPGNLQNDTQVLLRIVTLEDAPPLQEELTSVGSVYEIDLGTDQLQVSATLEIPFDSALIPENSAPDEVFLSYYDELEGEWLYAGGEVDLERDVVILEIDHVSLWAPATWNWDAWIAVLNKTLHGNVVDLVEATHLLTNDCPQTGEYVSVDSSQARNLIQGCIVEDDVERPRLRIVNPKSFFYEIESISGGNGYPSPDMLSPGEDVSFVASTSDPAPLTVAAHITQKSGEYLVVHMFISMLPGTNQVGIERLACLAERSHDTSYFIQAAEALLVDQNGTAAAEELLGFMNDADAVRRFVTTADDCNVVLAPTWSTAGIKQMATSTATIMSATDYIANYFAGNTHAEISFVWSSSGFGSDAVWDTPSDSFIEFQTCIFDSPSPLECTTTVMRSNNASPRAIEFAQLLQGEGYMVVFAEHGRVDLAQVVYPGRANGNFQNVLINGTPQIVSVEDVWDINIREDPTYLRLLQEYPNLILWASDNRFESMQQTTEGGQRFIFSYPIVDGCHACDVIGAAFVAFDFSIEGYYSGPSLIPSQ